MAVEIIDHFQSKRTGLNPENVTLVLEEASRRLGDEAGEKAVEKKSFKQTVKKDKIQACLFDLSLSLSRLIW